MKSFLHTRLWHALNYLVFLIVCLLTLYNGIDTFASFYSHASHLLLNFSIASLSDLSWAQIADTPMLMLGVLITLSSFGLLFRSRFMWFITLLLLSIKIILMLNWSNLHEALLSWNSVNVLFLLLLSRQFYKKSSTIGLLFTITNFLGLLFYACYGVLYFGQGFSPPITDLSTAFYYSIETMTTVGYGDIVPVSVHARLFIVSVILLGITIFAASLTSILGPFVSESLQTMFRGEKRKMDRKNHLIFCGYSSLAESTINSLISQGEAITWILPTRLNSDSEHKKYDVIYGDIANSELLKTAGIQNAQSVIAISDNDADNAFIVLSVKELNPDCQTVALLNENDNLNKLKMVQPDVLLSLSLFGAELLSRMLTKQPIDNDYLHQVLFGKIPSQTKRKNPKQPAKHD